MLKRLDIERRSLLRRKRLVGGRFDVASRRSRPAPAEGRAHRRRVAHLHMRHPANGAGCWTLFLSLNLAIGSLATSRPADGPADLMLQCGVRLDRRAGVTYFVRRSNVVLDRTVCFLDVSSLNLAAPQAPPFLLLHRAQGKQADAASGSAVWRADPAPANDARKSRSSPSSTRTAAASPTCPT